MPASQKTLSISQLIKVHTAFAIRFPSIHFWLSPLVSPSVLSPFVLFPLPFVLHLFHFILFFPFSSSLSSPITTFPYTHSLSYLPLITFLILPSLITLLLPTTLPTQHNSLHHVRRRRIQPGTHTIPYHTHLNTKPCKQHQQKQQQQ